MVSSHPYQPTNLNANPQAIFTLVRQTRATRRAMRASPMLNLFGEDSPVESSPAHILATSGSTAPLVRESCRDKRNRLLRRLGVDRGDQVENGQLQDKVFGIAMRISLYPISLIAVNSIVSGDRSMHTLENPPCWSDKRSGRYSLHL